MTTVKMTATRFQERPGEALDRSLTTPVVVLKHGRPRNVVMSYEEYDRLMRRDRRAFAIEELDNDELAVISAARMERGHSHLDEELAPEKP